jgi:hypothetical protein
MPGHIDLEVADRDDLRRGVVEAAQRARIRATSSLA